MSGIGPSLDLPSPVGMCVCHPLLFLSNSLRVCMLRSRLYAITNDHVDSGTTHHADVNCSPPTGANQVMSHDELHGPPSTVRAKTGCQQTTWANDHNTTPSTATDCCGGVEISAHCHKTAARCYHRERDRVPEEVGSLHSSLSSETQARHTSPTSTSSISKHENSYWTQWMEDFTQNYKVI